MGCLVHRVAVVAAFFVAFLSVEMEAVSGLRSVDLALRRSGDDDALQDKSATLGITPSPAMVFDPNASQKRRVRRGEDPIHNKLVGGAHFMGDEQP
ncbi:hypothetical protein AAHA92_01936 [Salvia divinorum]|uniref:Uncharacterized protein n=1 Tax=Salvia divinorum TaxID=28513 RepID=A0ABD1IC65_SALDI